MIARYCPLSGWGDRQWAWWGGFAGFVVEAYGAAVWVELPVQRRAAPRPGSRPKPGKARTARWQHVICWGHVVLSSRSKATKVLWNHGLRSGSWRMAGTQFSSGYYAYNLRRIRASRSATTPWMLEYGGSCILSPECHSSRSLAGEHVAARHAHLDGSSPAMYTRKANVRVARAGADKGSVYCC